MKLCKIVGEVEGNYDNFYKQMIKLNLQTLVKNNLIREVTIKIETCTFISDFIFWFINTALMKLKAC